MDEVKKGGLHRVPFLCVFFFCLWGCVNLFWMCVFFVGVP